MTPDRSQRIDRIYQLVRDIEPGRRGPFLDEACHSDPDLRREVELLLAKGGTGGGNPASNGAGETTGFEPGARLGPYRIDSVVGTGGMGQVFRATDTRLNRDVAIKISAAAFGERFEREARAVASLNHPNVCTLHDVGPNYLVMELVEGPTLADRIQQGPLPLDEALAIARQIAEALEAAHEKGIVHRDLKPGNVKIRPDGMVKVLDFGLATAGGGAAAQSDNSPTIVASATEAGVILGTAAYMSPEQAKGRPVDKRTDIWSFGVVLYEMLTGKRLFRGDATTEVLASVLKDEPRWDLAPVQVHRLLRRCLEKDPQKRLRHIGDVMALVDDPPEAHDNVAAPAKTSRLWAAVAAVLFAVSAVFAFLYFRPKPAAPERQARFQIPIAENTRVNAFSISPDGQRLVFGAVSGSGSPRLWIRTLDSLEARPLSDTDGAQPRTFWSPDSRFIGFAAQGKLKKMDAGGGPPQIIADLPSGYAGGSWNTDGVIIYGSPQGIMRVSAAGGTPAAITAIDRDHGEQAHLVPTFLPDGEHFLYMRIAGPESLGVYIGAISAKPDQQGTARLLATSFAPAVVPSSDSSSAQVLFLRDGTLLDQTLDLKTLQLRGEPVPVVEQVGGNGPNRAGFFTASGNGVLVFRTGVAGATDISQPTWYDRQGKMLDTPGEPKAYTTLVLSPDASRAAVTLANDLWVIDLSRGTSTRLTSSASIVGAGTAATSAGVWSPDGDRIAYVASPGGVLGVYQKPSNGAGVEQLLWKGQHLLGPSHWSPDGNFLLFGATAPGTSADSWALPMQGEHKAYPLLHSQFAELGARFSPDSRWVAYISNESGRTEIYVQPFSPPPADASSAPPKYLVSKGGAAGMPRWRSDGKELYYLTTDGKIMAVDITATPEFRAGEPKMLFQAPSNFVRGNSPGALADVTADGKRFLLLTPAGRPTGQDQFTVIMNWNAANRGQANR